MAQKRKNKEKLKKKRVAQKKRPRQ